MPITKVHFGTFNVDESTGGVDVPLDISDERRCGCIQSATAARRETKSVENDARCDVRKTMQVAEKTEITCPVGAIDSVLRR
jgi:hypothetical protein